MYKRQVLYSLSLFCSSIIFTINNNMLIVFWLNLTFLTELVYFSYTTLFYNCIVSKMGTYVELIIIITCVSLIHNYLRFIDRILSVSYTHLDVYKRQSLLMIFLAYFCVLLPKCASCFISCNYLQNNVFVKS